MNTKYRICQLAVFVFLLTIPFALLTGCGAPSDSVSPSTEPDAPTQAPATAAPTQEPTSAPAPDETADEPAEPEEPTPGPNLVDVEFTEEDYARLIEDINLNPEVYLDKTLRLSGLYLTEQPDGFNFTTHYIHRISSTEDEDIGDGDAAFLGLQFIPPEGFTAENGDWIRVEGTFRPVSLDGYPFFALDEVQAVVDNEHRGEEVVMDLH